MGVSDGLFVLGRGGKGGEVGMVMFVLWYRDNEEGLWVTTNEYIRWIDRNNASQTQKNQSFRPT